MATIEELLSADAAPEQMAEEYAKAHGVSHVHMVSDDQITWVSSDEAHRLDHYRLPRETINVSIDTSKIESLLSEVERRLVSFQTALEQLAARVAALEAERVQEVGTKEPFYGGWWQPTTTLQYRSESGDWKTVSDNVSWSFTPVMSGSSSSIGYANA